MEKVFVLVVDYRNDGDTVNDILGVFRNIDDARKAMNDAFETDKNDSWFSICYDENGKFDEDYADERGIELEISKNDISIYENYWDRFTHFTIKEHKIK